MNNTTPSRNHAWADIALDELESDFSECELEWKCLHESSSFQARPLLNHTSHLSNQRRSFNSPSASFQRPIAENGNNKQNSRTYPPAVASGSLVCFPGKRRLCLFGGVTDSGTTNETWIYELGIQHWKKVEFDGLRNYGSQSPPSFSGTVYESSTKCVLPPKRCGHIAVTMNGNEMFMFGGHNVEEVVYYHDLWVFRPDPIPQWKMLSPFGSAPSSRWYCSAVTSSDQLIIYGGEGEDYQILGDVTIYSKLENRWMSLRTVFPSPKPRMLHSACMVEESMIIVGGIGKDDTSTADVWSFDTKVMSWTEIKTTGPSPFDSKSNSKRSLYGHQSSVWGRFVIIYGGRRENMLNSAIWMLDLQRNAWTEISKNWTNLHTIPSNRWKHMLCSDHYSHVSSKSHQDGDRERLSELVHSRRMLSPKGRDRDNKHDLQDTERDDNELLPAELLLQKLTKTYIYGGAGQTKRYGDLWEFSLQVHKHELYKARESQPD